MDVQVILIEDDPKLGKKGQVIKVSQGYAQNYLLPQRKARIATAGAVKEVERAKQKQEREEARLLDEAQKKANQLRAMSLTLKAASGEEDKLFGSVTSQDIAEALVKRGIAIDRKEIHLAEPIKKLGGYEVLIKLHSNVSVTLKVWVETKND